MIWILIIGLSIGNGGAALQTVPFGSKKACEQAAEKIEAKNNEYAKRYAYKYKPEFSAICVQK